MARSSWDSHQTTTAAASVQEGKVTAPWPHGLLSKKAVQLKRPLSRDQSPYSEDLRLGSHWWPGHQDTSPCHLHPEGREPAGPLRSLVLLGLAAAALPLEHETEKGPCSTGVVPARDLLASRECACHHTSSMIHDIQLFQNISNDFLNNNYLLDFIDTEKLPSEFTKSVFLCVILETFLTVS